MKKIRFLWVDDEIDLMRPYILFLEEKGYEVTTVNNGQDAIDACKESYFDLIFLDENMPGLSGLETLTHINAALPSTPVVMVTKSEDEGIMNKAIGKKIADYLIKPVNPNQILMTIKKNLEKSTIIHDQTTAGYREEFVKLSMKINACETFEDWMEAYKALVYWELELSDAQNEMLEMLMMQKADANNEYAKFIKRNYQHWMTVPEDKPMQSPDLFKKRVFPMLDNNEKLFFVLIDNFRLDQWLVIKDIVAEFFTFEEDMYCSILPTATQYARNAIFSGLMPLQIKEMFPKLWIDEDEEDSKNLHEQALIHTHFERYRRQHQFSYHKINNNHEAEKLLDHFIELEKNELNVLVFNFVDMLSHARTESKMIRELASTEAAYRSLTRSWFIHSPLLPLLKKIAESNFKVILTTDHGTIRVKNGLKVVGDRNTNTNLRYKLGKNMSYKRNDVYEMINPSIFGLPSPNLTTRYIFAMNDDFFAYPNNFNYYVSYFENTFQHGGISMEEMIIPIITLFPK